MQRHKKEASLKEIRKAIETLSELRDQMRGKYVPLKHKIFAGHWRFLVVREDVLRSSIGGQIQKIVNECNHWCRGNKKDPNSYHTGTELFDVGCQNIQYLHPLNQRQWDAANFPEFFAKKWFVVKTTYKNVGTKNIPIHRYFPKVPKYMLDFKFKPAYITESFIPNGDLESQIHSLNEFIWENKGWERLQGNRRDEWDLSLTKKKALEQLNKKEARLLED